MTFWKNLWAKGEEKGEAKDEMSEILSVLAPGPTDRFLHEARYIMTGAVAGLSEIPFPMGSMVSCAQGKGGTKLKISGKVSHDSFEEHRGFSIDVKPCKDLPWVCQEGSASSVSSFMFPDAPKFKIDKEKQLANFMVHPFIARDVREGVEIAFGLAVLGLDGRRYEEEGTRRPIFRTWIRPKTSFRCESFLAGRDFWKALENPDLIGFGPGRNRDSMYFIGRIGEVVLEFYSRVVPLFSTEQAAAAWALSSGENGGSS